MFMMFLLSLMLCLFSGGSTKVVNDFSGCGDFFKNGITPTILYGAQYKLICQTVGDTPYYATVYDTQNKIPIYSAYKFTKIDCLVRRQNNWYIEPQLDGYNGYNMEPENRRNFNNQASNADYASSTALFDKGHLAPVSQSNSQECASATFTLTNAAPQYKSFNRGQWRVIESKMVQIVTSQCIGKTAYIVTGVVPGGGNLNNRVNVPSHFWTAYCCQTNQGLISGAAIGVNSKQNQKPEILTVTGLESNLKGLYNANTFTLFDNNCRDANYVPVKNQK